jgi:CBS domain-containing protein
MKVSEIMAARVTAVAPFDTVAFAEQLMTAERIRHLPVVDGDVVVGVLSQRDVLAASISSVDRPLEDDDRVLKAQLRVSQIMRGFVETVRPDTDLVEAADRLLEQKIGCLPVVNERLHLLGIVTEADFVQLCRDLLASTGSPGSTR